MKIAKRILPLLFLLLIATCAPAQEIGKPAPLFEVKDIFDKTLDLRQMKGWIIFIGFGNVDNYEVSVNWLKELRLAIPDRDNVFFLAVADTRKYRLLKMFAKGVITKGYDDEIKEFDSRMKDRNITVKGNIRDNFLLVTDWSGSVFGMYGLSGSADKPHLFIIDGDGVLRGHFTESDSMDSMVALTKQIIKESDEKTVAAAKLKFGKARKSWTGNLVWYPIAALAFYYAVK